MRESKKYRVAHGTRYHLGDVDPDAHGSFANEADALHETEACIRKIDPLQERLYAEGKRSLLIILQALDTGGKDGTIRHVMRGINPQGCQVTSFKLPTPEELAHDYLWRIHQHVPAKGLIGIFNRSHYEDVLVVRVHSELLRRQGGSDRAGTTRIWARRFQEINDWEHHLVANDIAVVKVLLNVSKAEQARRFIDRIDRPEKN